MDGPRSFIHQYETYGSDGSYVTHARTITGPFYHGGRARVRAGGTIVPGHRTNSWGDERGIATWVYFSTEIETAAAYARATQGYLYEVEPPREAQWDGSGGDGSYKTREPLTVIRRILPEEYA